MGVLWGEGRRVGAVVAAVRVGAGGGFYQGLKEMRRRGPFLAAVGGGGVVGEPRMLAGWGAMGWVRRGSCGRAQGAEKRSPGGLSAAVAVVFAEAGAPTGISCSGQCRVIMGRGERGGGGPRGDLGVGVGRSWWSSPNYWDSEEVAGGGGLWLGSRWGGGGCGGGSLGGSSRVVRGGEGPILGSIRGGGREGRGR